MFLYHRLRSISDMWDVHGAGGVSDGSICIYPVPFHTYFFRSLMHIEFHEDELGREVLDDYEIGDDILKHDTIVLFFYGLVATRRVNLPRM